MASLQYWSPKRGWWTGHKNLPPTKESLEAYADGLNQDPKYRVRILLENGDILGDSSPCGVCREIHDGLDGSCLLT